MRHLFLLTLAAALSLAACDKGKEGSSFAVTGTNGTGGTMDGSGRVKIDTPLFQGSFKLPKVQLDAKNFDINGVHLYPGSRIRAVNVDAGEDDGRVVVRFDSPAAPATVRDWLADEFRKKGTAVSVDGNALTGKDEDGETFTIDLAPNGTGATGTVHLG